MIHDKLVFNIIQVLFWIKIYIQYKYSLYYISSFVPIGIIISSIDTHEKY